MQINELLTRGVEQLMPQELAHARIASGKKLRVYFGIDPTGSQLHLGHTIPLRKLRDFAEHGHHVIFLIGSYTAMIGDPTGRDATRQPLTREQVEENFKTYKKQAAKVLDFNKVKIVYNHEWLEKLRLDEVMKLGSYFTVQQMLQRDMFQKRLKAEEPLSPNEFLYPLMQGYDSVMLEVDCEIGGNDQLFNMMAGRTLLRALKNKEKFVLTTPLIEGTDGRKMSKTYNNTINLTDAPGDMFGKIMSMADNVIIKYFILCTDVSLKEIDAIDAHMKSGGNPRDAKVRLARELVTMYHSKPEADAAEREFIEIFQKKGLPDEIPEFKLNGDRELTDLLLLCKLAETKSEGRRLIEQGGVKIDNSKATDPKAIIRLKAGMVIQAGKRKWARVV
ncbi:tyrosine--tRNA ligase [Candidatus Peregrinibacteria bacterium]|nr:tyrosine--tRNA ligase [Candidatus Peregrinibacteria bacterium]